MQAVCRVHAECIWAAFSLSSSRTGNLLTCKVQDSLTPWCSLGPARQASCRLLSAATRCFSFTAVSTAAVICPTAEASKVRCTPCQGVTVFYAQWQGCAVRSWSLDYEQTAEFTRFLQILTSLKIMDDMVSLEPCPRRLYGSWQISEPQMLLYFQQF